MLVISQMFPCKRHPTSAIFFANLINELASLMDDLIIITPRAYIPKFLTKIKKKWIGWFVDPMISKNDRMEIIRPHILTLPGIKFTGLNGIIMQYSLNKLVKRLISERKIDIILGNNILPEGIAAERLANKFKLPVVNWCIGTDINIFAEHNYLNHHLTKKCIERSNLMITTSKHLECKVKEYANNNKNVMTFYRGIDLLNFKENNLSDSIKSNFYQDGKAKYILFVGRLIKSKGIYELAEAFNTVTAMYPELKLIVIGEEIEKDSFLNKIKDDKTRDKINFKGIVSHDMVAKYMQAAELLVFPSWSEGLPNVVIEAMAVGLPVVASNVGGIPEVLVDGVTGLSVPPHNTTKLTEAILKMLGDDHLKATCVSNAKDLIDEKFDVKKNAASFHDILQQVVRNYARSH